jgi:hypothetical protein
MVKSSLNTAKYFPGDRLNREMPELNSVYSTSPAKADLACAFATMSGFLKLPAIWHGWEPKRSFAQLPLTHQTDLRK